MSNDTEIDIKLITDHVEAASEVLNEACESAHFMTTAGPDDAIALCLISAVVPAEYADAYMMTMEAMHRSVIKKFPEVVWKPRNVH